MPHNLYSQNFKNIENSAFNNFQDSVLKLREDIRNHKIGAVEIVNKTDDLEEFFEISKKISAFEKIIILGVGGSSLGAKTLCSLKIQDKVEFIESIDPQTISKSLDKINFEKTFFIVTSKSGQTIETTCQTLIIIEKFQNLKIANFAKQFLFITENKESFIRQIAINIDAKILPHPNNIGGRYSVFSIVGLLPALLCGIDIKKIRTGAKKIIDNFLNDDQISSSVATQINLYDKGFINNVMMPYVDNLENFNHWYRQLWAESLGKNNFGSIPVNSMGTVDQHSQLQLYLEGPKNKFFTFITLKNHPKDLLIKDLTNVKTFFGNKKLSEIVKIEETTTIEVLNQKKLPIRIFEIENLDEEVLGGLMMQMFLETILTAYIKNINPFDQPAVELRKDLAKKLLS